MMEMIQYDISNSTRARETIRAIRALELEEDNPLANLDRDDFLEVESQLTPKKWDLRKTVFVCYAATQLDMPVDSGENIESNLLHSVIQNELDSMSFYLYNSSISQIRDSADLARNKSSKTACLIQAYIPYTAIKQIDGFFGPKDFHSEKDKKQWLIDYARDIWKTRPDSYAIEVSFGDSCEICISSIENTSRESANCAGVNNLQVKIGIKRKM